MHTTQFSKNYSNTFTKFLFICQHGILTIRLDSEMRKEMKRLYSHLGERRKRHNCGFLPSCLVEQWIKEDTHTFLFYLVCIYRGNLGIKFFCVNSIDFSLNLTPFGEKQNLSFDAFLFLRFLTSLIIQTSDVKIHSLHFFSLLTKPLNPNKVQESEQNLLFLL